MMRFEKKLIVIMLAMLMGIQIPVKADSLNETVKETNKLDAQTNDQSGLTEEQSKSKAFDFMKRKKVWEQEKKTANSLQLLGFITGSVGLIGATALYYDGENQRSNAKFVRKGNYMTNEDDVNAGNAKVLQSGLILIGAAGLLIVGAVQSARLGPLEREGRRKGFVVSMKENNGVTFQYAWDF